MPMLERTVNFDTKNSWTDFGIVFESMTIGGAEPRLILIDVPFRNGSLDETDYFGDVRYRDRILSMNFLIPWETDDQHSVYSEVQNQLNGMRKKITFSADQDWYYEGRLSVGDFKVDNGFFKFPITATVDPYKYKDTTVNQTTTSSGTTIVLENSYMKTIPTITNSAAISVTFESNSYEFTAGTHKNASIVLKKGNNTMVITGNATVSISYRQGKL